MTQIWSSVTARGQVTIPAEVRRSLGVQPGEKIIFEIDGDQVRLLRPPLTLEEVYRSVPSLSHIGDVEEIIELAKEERAKEYLAKMRGQ